MFTIPQIQQAHSKVKSGADFPAYIQDLVKLGVRSYETYVHDGHTDYKGDDGYTVSSPPKYTAQQVADVSNAPLFISNLRAHQQGQSDYPTFCQQAAATGVEKWAVDTTQLTCTYFDKAGNQLLVENIPVPKV